MNSHSRRRENRKWLRDHISQVGALVLNIKQSPDYEFDYVGCDNTLEMRKKQISAFGVQKTKSGWIEFLRNKNVDLNTFDLNIP